MHQGYFCHEIGLPVPAATGISFDEPDSPRWSSHRMPLFWLYATHFTKPSPISAPSAIALPDLQLPGIPGFGRCFGGSGLQVAS